VGHDTKHCPTSKNQTDPGDEKYKARTCCTKWRRRPHPATGYGDDAGPSRRGGCIKSEELRHLNEELCRDLQNHASEREEEDHEPVTPPKEFPMSFS